MSEKSIDVNGRSYQWPSEPLVVICCDGSEVDYTDEAMAAGLPVIVSRTCGCFPELVEEGVTGLGFSPDDAEAVWVMVRWEDFLSAHFDWGDER